MTEKMTITELLNSMQKRDRTESVGSRTLSNSKDTWQRIANKDSFEELGFSDESEKEKFLKEWINDNPYSNI